MIPIGQVLPHLGKQVVVEQKLKDTVDPRVRVIAI